MSTNVHYTESLLGVEQFKSLRACMVAVGHFYFDHTHPGSGDPNPLTLLGSTQSQLGEG